MLLTAVRELPTERRALPLARLMSYLYHDDRRGRLPSLYDECADLLGKAAPRDRASTGQLLVDNLSLVGCRHYERPAIALLNAIKWVPPEERSILVKEFGAQFGYSLPADRLRLFKQFFDISEDFPPGDRHILLNEMTEVLEFKTLGAPLTAAKSLALECTARLPVDYRVHMLCHVVRNLHDCAPGDIKALYERLLAATLDLPAHLRREPLAALGLEARLLCKDVGPHIYPELIAHARALPADDQGRVLKDILQRFDVKTEEEVKEQVFDASFPMSRSLSDQHRAEVIALLARLADSLDPKRRCDEALFAIWSEVRDMAPGPQAMTRSKLSQYWRWDAISRQWAEPGFGTNS